MGCPRNLRVPGAASQFGQRVPGGNSLQHNTSIDVRALLNVAFCNRVTR